MAKPLKIPQSVPRKPPLLVRLRKEKGSFVYYGKKGWRWTNAKDFNKRVLVKSRKVRTHKLADAKRGLANSLTKPHPLDAFGNKRFLTGIILLSLILFGVLISNQVLKTYEVIPAISTQQNFWLDNNFVNNGGEFRFFQGGEVNGCVTGGINCISFTSGGQQGSVALTRQPITIDTVGGHEFAMQMGYCAPIGFANSGNRWGMYLTRNGTLPISGNYDPKADKSVSIILEVQDTGGGNIDVWNWVQKNATEPITNGDVSAGTQGTGTLFQGLVTTQDTGTGCAGTVAHNTNLAAFLNFTGVKSVNGVGGLSTIYESVPGAASNVQSLQPWLQFQGISFYVGFYQLQCTSCNPIRFIGQSINEVARVDPPMVNPELDATGFFGPLIRALVTVGVFILQTLITVFTFIVQVVKAALDAVGNFVGLGNIGTALFQILSAAGAFINSAVNAIFSQLSNIVGFITSAATAIVAFLGSGGSFIWTQVTNFFGIWQVLFPLFNTAFLLFTAFSQNGVQLAQYALVFWWLYGIFVVLNSGTEKWWNHWVGMGEDAFKKTFNLGYWIVELVFHWLVWMKNLIAQWV